MAKLKKQEPEHTAGVKTQVTIERQESSFDRACDNAYRMALMMFGSDDDGYLTNVKDNCRTTDCVCCEFKSYSRYGHSHLYMFDVWVERAEDDDDE